jgi:GTPase
VGNVDSGKSTTLGVLTRGGLDDGRGRARVALFRHKHEIETGRTSSVGMEVRCNSINCILLIFLPQILGFGPNGQPILPSADVNADSDVIRRERLGWEQIVSKSSKIVSFIDLAGHEKYLKVQYFSDTAL